MLSVQHLEYQRAKVALPDRSARQLGHPFCYLSDPSHNSLAVSHFKTFSRRTNSHSSAIESPRSSAEAMARELNEEYGNLVPYTAPIWARERGLKIVPEKRYVVSDNVIINAHTCKMYPHLVLN